MVELHGWITLRETYEVTDEENFEVILKQINDEIEKLKYSKFEIKMVNGEAFIEILLCTNHMSPDVKEIISFYTIVGNVARGSYGLLYLHNDEDKNNYNNFMVYRLARGKVEIFKDNFLSPTVSVIEDIVY